MESFGKLLQTTRENKQIDIETVVEQTTISRNHIIALENEQIDSFPGEPYLVGFLKNYSEYLGLNSAQVLALYRAKKIQEAPPPSALLQRQYPKYLKPLIAFGIIFVVVGLGLLSWFLFFSKNNEDLSSHTVLGPESESHRYELSNQPLQKRLYEGDVIAVPTSGGFIDVIVSKTLNELQLITPAGTQFLELSEEREIDIDGQKGAEIIVYLSDISRTDAERGAEMRVLLKDPSLAVIGETDLEIIPDSDDIKNQQYIILQDNRAYPFTLNITLRSACVLRYKTDKNDPVEDYYVSGDMLTMQANNGTRLWVSNLNALKIQVLAGGNSFDLEVGKAGRVEVQDIKWIRDSDGTYKLAVINVD